MNIAAIAIGSNSTRMLVRRSDGREWRERAYTRLFMGLDQQGLLTEQAMADTTQAIGQLKLHALALGAERVLLYATSAVRDARNAEAFADLLLSRTGLRLNILSGESEACLAFEAASDGRDCAVLDIGGGSTELTYGRDGRADLAVSAQEGASRLLRQGPIRTEADAERLTAEVRERLRTVYAPLLSRPRPPILIGIGGTCTTSAAIHRGIESHGDELNGETISRSYIAELLRRIAPLTLEDRAQIPGLYPERAAMMPHGLCILCAAMDLTGFDRITLSTRNNLDAILAREAKREISGHP